MAVCYRHPNRETGVSCSSCGRPICPDCMTPTPVGMRCPECARERTKVRTMRSMPRAAVSVTQALVVVNVLVFIVEVATGTPLGGAEGGKLVRHAGLYGPALTSHNINPFISGTHQYWRLVTAGFLHYSLLHIAFNMFFLYIMGQMLEPAIGPLNFAAVYIASLLAGSFGALLFQPDALTVGASGACFGVLGALIAIARARRISIWRTGLGPTLLINVVFSLSVAGISIGGHLGGLVGGFLAGSAVVELGERRGQRAAALASCAAVAAVSVVAAIAVAGSHGLTPNGLSFGG
jgi:membrane associated rhomboid family serine protease